MDFSKLYEKIRKDFDGFLESKETEWEMIFPSENSYREGGSFLKKSYNKNLDLVYFSKPLFKLSTGTEIEDFLTTNFLGIYKRDTKQFFVDRASLGTSWFLDIIGYNYEVGMEVRTYSMIENWTIDVVNEVHKEYGLDPIHFYGDIAVPFVCDAIAAGGTKSDYRKYYEEKILEELSK